MSNKQYDCVAPHYRNISAERASYLAAVDNCIVQRISASVQSFCDIGAADGVRGLNLAKRLGAQKIYLCEPSPAMVQLCEQNSRAENYGDVHIWQGTADHIPDSVGMFDVIVCLWNVLGHMPDSKERVRSLKKMASMLAPGGRIFLDVNNRHNAAAYGALRVFWRQILDTVFFDEKRGDASYIVDLPNCQVEGMGHLFTPAEVSRLCQQAGLHIRDFFSIDYKTGQPNASKRLGQLFLMLENNSSAEK